MNTRLLAVVASVRERSVTRCAVMHVIEAAKKLGAETDVVDLREIRLPMYDPDGDDTTEYRQILDKVNWANAFLLGSPDYHGSMSGAMKNFLDHFWKEFAGKLFGYVCSSHEKGLTAMDQMRTVVRQCYGWSLPYGVSLSREDLAADGRSVQNPRVATRLDMVAYDLNAYAPLLAKQFQADLARKSSNAGFAAHYREGE